MGTAHDDDHDDNNDDMHDDDDNGIIGTFDMIWVLLDQMTKKPLLTCPAPTGN